MELEEAKRSEIIENDKSLVLRASEAILGIQIPTNSTTRTKENRNKSWSYVWDYVKKEKTLVHYGLLSLVGSLLIDLSVPIYIGVMTDEL